MMNHEPLHSLMLVILKNTAKCSRTPIRLSNGDVETYVLEDEQILHHQTLRLALRAPKVAPIKCDAELTMT